MRSSEMKSSGNSYLSPFSEVEGRIFQFYVRGLLKIQAGVVANFGFIYCDPYVCFYYVTR